jgi:Domain of unknown function (DUF4134)
MGGIYGTLRDTFIYASALAAIIAGFNIFQKWNRGEDVRALIYGWLYGIVISNSIVWAVSNFIVNGAIMGKNPTAFTKDLGLQVYSATLIIGLIIAIIGIIDIYRKYTEGEEITALIFKWISSIIFLFFFGNIISAML